uniref:Stress-induced receptor-like kinase n=1 Tax=Rhizophora mucronata TaxID=61149 RepID=A0A2P2KXN3_RHIMU
MELQKYALQRNPKGHSGQWNCRNKSESKNTIYLYVRWACHIHTQFRYSSIYNFSLSLHEVFHTLVRTKYTIRMEHIRWKWRKVIHLGTICQVQATNKTARINNLDPTARNIEARHGCWNRSLFLLLLLMSN